VAAEGVAASPLLRGPPLALAVVAAPPLYRSPPALGWNDWNEIARKYPPWHPAGVNETIVLQQAAALAKLGGLYRYVNLDCGWSTGKRSTAGKLQLDRTKYPSGLPALSAKLRGMGLALGIYTSGRMCCGIGSDGHPGGDGSEGQEAVDVATFAEWGVEYIKDDDCGSSADHFRKMAAAIKVSYAGKPVVYSIHSPWTHNSTLHPRAVDAAGFASSWRTTNDIKDDWAAVLDRSATNDRYAALNVPGHHNDPDMLECNNSLTDVESASHFALWAIMKAPLLVGTDLTAASEATLATLGNAGVLALSQDTLGQQARRLVSATGHQVWGGQLAGGGYVLMLLDTASGALPLSVKVTLPVAVKRTGAYAVTDVWSGKALPEVKAGATEYLMTVTERHGNALVRLAPKQQ
jgi:alpha-galactosidase